VEGVKGVEMGSREYSEVRGEGGDGIAECGAGR